jgi:hypothetical protein
MTRHRGKAPAFLRQARILAMGIAMGSTIATPVLAAVEIPIGDIPIGDITEPLLWGSLALLVIGLVLKAKYGNKKSAPPAAPKAFSEGIGRYRLQLGRGEAY